MTKDEPAEMCSMLSLKMAEKPLPVYKYIREPHKNMGSITVMYRPYWGAYIPNLSIIYIKEYMYYHIWISWNKI